MTIQKKHRKQTCWPGCVTKTVTCHTINKDSSLHSVFVHHSTLGTKFRKESSMKIRPALTLVKHNSSFQRRGLLKYLFSSQSRVTGAIIGGEK